ncbi:MAG: MarR family winged helix-turn-helix transcriptional regulator [Gemmatimonas sp.]|jgi:DNA-binding MarR family transcriptional regulator|uniref:MarR family winged helix-turn-helix transcriptional regulator n=1 Tax=Gemmatimonas sp. TaxID=1962908 RepID=UPI00391F9AB8
MTARQQRDVLRLWLRLFSCTTLVERDLDRALKREFGSSLPRFDLLAQLDRAPDGLRMGELSERTLTTGGNVTWLVRALAAEGHVIRHVATEDRRATVVQLTAAGRRHFARMARAHAQWVASRFRTLSRHERSALYTTLGQIKSQFVTPGATE